MVYLGWVDCVVNLLVYYLCLWLQHMHCKLCEMLLCMSCTIDVHQKCIAQLRKEIAELFSDLLGPLPLELPPHREVLHEIPLIDESKQLKHRLPKCPEAFRPKLARKIERYTMAGWWIPAADKQATPMLCIPKTNSTLRTVFDLRQQNNNTWKDVTPFPEQDTIRHDVVRAQFRSKLDMTEAYE